MADFLSFMKFAGSPEAADLGKKASSFTDDVITLLTDIRAELREHNAREREREESRGE